MAAILTPQADATLTDAKPDAEAMPLINPITVSLALAVLFLIALLAVVAVKPTNATELQGADDRQSAETERYAAALGSD